MGAMVTWMWRGHQMCSDLKPAPQTSTCLALYIWPGIHCCKLIVARGDSTTIILLNRKSIKLPSSVPISCLIDQWSSHTGQGGFSVGWTVVNTEIDTWSEYRERVFMACSWPQVGHSMHPFPQGSETSPKKGKNVYKSPRLGSARAKQSLPDMTASLNW